MALLENFEDPTGGEPLDIQSVIDQFYAEFPERKKDVFVLNHQKYATGKEALESIKDVLDAAIEGKVGGFKKTLVKGVANATYEAQMPVSVSFDNAQQMSEYSDSFARVVVPAGPKFSARLLSALLVGVDGRNKDEVAFPSLPKELNNTEMWQRYVLEHELGHAITILGMDKQKSKDVDYVDYLECMADAYAVMRNFQRYGEDSKLPEYVAGLRTIAAVHAGKCDHLTTRAIDKVIELNKDGKIKDLTPEESRKLAMKIADEVALSRDAEHNLQEEFKPENAGGMQQMMKEMKQGTYQPKSRDYNKTVARVGEIGGSTRSPAVHELAKRYLEVIDTFHLGDGLNGAKLEEARAKVNANTPDAVEPAEPASKKALRDLFTDAQSGILPGGKDNAPAAKKPEPPKNDNGGGIKVPLFKRPPKFG